MNSRDAETDRWETGLYAEAERESSEADGGHGHNENELNQRENKKT